MQRQVFQFELKKTVKPQTDFTRLIHEIQVGDITHIKKMIENKKLQINKQHDGYTLLHYAVERGNLEIIQLLLEQKADPKIMTKDGQSVLHLALFSDKIHSQKKKSTTQALLKNLSLLLKYGADIEKENLYYYTPMTCALHLFKDQAEVAMFFGTRGAKLDQFIKYFSINNNLNDVPALTTALLDNQIELVENFLKHKANMEKRDNFSNWGLTPIEWAIKLGRIEIFELLAKYGAPKAQASRHLLDIQKSKEKKQNPLIKAVEDRDIPAIKKYLAENPDYVYIQDDLGRDPLIKALLLPDEEIATLILEKKPNLTLKTKIPYEKTALIIALEYHTYFSFPLIKKMLDQGADPYTEGVSGENNINCLTVAANTLNFEFVQYFLENHNGPLLPSMSLHVLLARWLIDKSKAPEYEKMLNVLINSNKINLSYVDISLPYPILHTAVELQHISICKKLLEKKVEINFNVPFINQSALSLAIFKDNFELVKLLIQAGASLTNKFNENFLSDYIIKSTNSDVLSYLLQQQIPDHYLHSTLILTAIAFKKIDHAHSLLENLSSVQLTRENKATPPFSKVLKAVQKNTSLDKLLRKKIKNEYLDFTRKMALFKSSLEDLNLLKTHTTILQHELDELQALLEIPSGAVDGPVKVFLDELEILKHSLDKEKDVSQQLAHLHRYEKINNFFAMLPLVQTKLKKLKAKAANFDAQNFESKFVEESKQRQIEEAQLKQQHLKKHDADVLFREFEKAKVDYLAIVSKIEKANKVLRKLSKSFVDDIASKCRSAEDKLVSAYVPKLSTITKEDENLEEVINQLKVYHKSLSEFENEFQIYLSDELLKSEKAKEAPQKPKKTPKPRKVKLLTKPEVKPTNPSSKTVFKSTATFFSDKNKEIEDKIIKAKEKNFSSRCENLRYCCHLTDELFTQITLTSLNDEKQVHTDLGNYLKTITDFDDKLSLKYYLEALLVEFSIQAQFASYRDKAHERNSTLYYHHLLIDIDSEFLSHLTTRKETSEELHLKLNDRIAEILIALIEYNKYFRKDLSFIELIRDMDKETIKSPLLQKLAQPKLEIKDLPNTSAKKAAELDMLLTKDIISKSKCMGDVSKDFTRTFLWLLGIKLKQDSPNGRVSNNQRLLSNNWRHGNESRKIVTKKAIENPDFKKFNP